MITTDLEESYRRDFYFKEIEDYGSDDFHDDF